MKPPETILNSHPPKLFQTLKTGFNITASHVSLIFLPLLLDLYLWLGPKLLIKQWFSPTIETLSTAMKSVATAGTLDQVNGTIDLLRQFLEQYNLTSLIRTIPIGVPSIIARYAQNITPFGKSITFEMPDSLMIFLAVVAFTLIGFFLGTVYFNSISRNTTQPVEKFDAKRLLEQYGQSLVMALLLFAVLAIISIPGSMILAVVSMLSQAIGQFMVLLGIFALFWLIIPLIFAPHGIFVLNQKAFPSTLLSIRMVRFFLPGTGLFITTAALISEGLNNLWVLPDLSSWLMLLGIFGHAFVVTALITTSFVYYREGLKWMQDNIQRMSEAANKPENGGSIGTTQQ